MSESIKIASNHHVAISTFFAHFACFTAGGTCICSLLCFSRRCCVLPTAFSFPPVLSDIPVSLGSFGVENVKIGSFCH